MKNVDHPSYLLNESLKGKCDVFFPINFELIYSILNSNPTTFTSYLKDGNNNNNSIIKFGKSYQFMYEFGNNIKKRKFKGDGFNPFIQV